MQYRAALSPAAWLLLSWPWSLWFRRRRRSRNGAIMGAIRPIPAIRLTLSAYPDGYPIIRARPRATLPRPTLCLWRALYEDPYASGPRGQSYGGDDLELGVNFNQKTAAMVQNPTNEPAGTIVIDTSSRHLYLVQPGGGAIQYGIGVGRQGFAWKGVARVGHKSEWPRWISPKEMLQRRPDLPEEMDGGLDNPLGARALYLFQGNKDTLFRIHGTNEPDSSARRCPPAASG